MREEWWVEVEDVGLGVMMGFWRVCWCFDAVRRRIRPGMGFT